MSKDIATVRNRPQSSSKSMRILPSVRIHIVGMFFSDGATRMATNGSRYCGLGYLNNVYSFGSGQYIDVRCAKPRTTTKNY